MNDVEQEDNLSADHAEVHRWEKSIYENLRYLRIVKLQLAHLHNR